MYVGDGQQSLKYPLWNGTFADVPSVITQLLHRYQQERESAHESLGEFVNRVGAWGAKNGGA
jgi:sulfite reductase beta subunit-like hemoprotein